jgi:cellulose synthase (UDP-forming)
MRSHRPFQLGLILSAIVWALPTFAQEPAREFPGASGTYEAVLEDEYYQSTDVMLQGMHATWKTTFTRPTAWTLTADPVVHVAFDHSAALLPQRSHIVVSVNDHPLKTVELSADNVADGAFDVSVPRRLLDDYNQLAFDVEQHYTDDCEDPFDPTLWTRVHKTTSISLAYTRNPVEGELLSWPYPVFDKLGYGPTAITLVSPVSPSRETVEALGVVGFSVGRITDYREVESADPVAAAAEAHTPAAVIGT